MLSTINYSPGHRKLMLLFPVPVVLCLLLVFHGLGGGKDSAANHGIIAAHGINTNLPPARMDSVAKAPDKVQIYASAAADSQRFHEQQKQDPNIAGHPGLADTVMRNAWADAPGTQMAIDPHRFSIHAAADQPRPAINRTVDRRRLMADATAASLVAKIEQLQKELDKSAGGPGRMSGAPAPDRDFELRPSPVPDRTPSKESDPALAHLSALSQSLQATTKSTPDPEMERIDAMLDKLIRIQHPDLIVNDTTKHPWALRTFALEPKDQKEAVTSLQPGAAATEEEEVSTGFIEIGEEDKADTTRRQSEPALEAVIDGDQTVTSGSTVALRLVHAGVVNGFDIPSGQQFYGQVSIADQRMMIRISSLRVGDQVMPVSIQVYDLDGLAGIRVPGAVTREVSKESASEAISGLGLASMDPSLTGQAANAGLQLAKTLTSRKIRTIRVQLPAGYQVLLVNTKTK